MQQILVNILRQFNVNSHRENLQYLRQNKWEKHMNTK